MAVAAESDRPDDALAEMTKWVLDHGSTRLMKAHEAGLLDRCWSVYREERLALERPGWILWKNEIGKQQQIRNPHEHVLDAFLDAKDRWPEVELVWVQPNGIDGEPWLRDLLAGRTIAISVLNYRAQIDGEVST